MSRFIMPRQGVKGQNLNPADGAMLFFYTVGTTAFKDTFTDAAKSIASTNPVAADGTGLFAYIEIDGSYDVVLKDKNGVQLWGPETIQELVDGSESTAIQELTTATMTADTNRTYLVGDVVQTKEWSTGNGGGGVYDVVLTSGVTPDAIRTIIGVANALISFVLRVGTVIHPKQWGLLTDNTGASTNNTILEAIRVYVVSFSAGLRPSIQLPSGKIAYSTSPNWGRAGMSMRGPGPQNCQFIYSGSGVAFDIDPSAIDNAFRYSLHFEGFMVDLGANGTKGLFMENIALSTFKNIQCLNGSATVAIHFELLTCVLNTYDTCGTSVSNSPSTIHSETWRLGAGLSKSLPTTACTFNNLMAEGADSNSLRLIDADVCVFTGGTSESNTGRGVNIATTCRSNTFTGFDMEANTTADFDDAGQGTEWNNCLATSTNGGIISGSSVMSKINGGYYDTITIQAGAVSAVVENVSVNVKGTGGLTDAGTDTTISKIYDKDASAFVNTFKNDRSSITVGASPFTYKNVTNQAQQILVRVGTVSNVTWKRGTDTVEVGGAEGGNVNNSFWLSPDDELVVTYSSLPVMNLIPMGVANL